MKVWILNSVFTGIFFVDRKIRNHTPADKFILKKLPGKSHVFYACEFVLQGDVKAVGELGFRMPYAEERRLFFMLRLRVRKIVFTS